VLLKSLDSVGSQNEPKFEGSKSLAECNLPVLEKLNRNLLISQVKLTSFVVLAILPIAISNGPVTLPCSQLPFLNSHVGDRVGQH